MGSKGIRKIDKCDNCLEKNAEYMYWYLTGFAEAGIRLLCKDCAKVKIKQERLGI